ncbi:MAG TPA: DUF1232 domain-containing protein [Vicinamibacterales bacterium]|nr:DUF1232 domain-containing protein [Vicinamibacterales bacterium]
MRSWLSRPALLRTLVAQARLAIRLLRDRRVPWLVKGVPLLAALYLVAPLDFVPDMFPVLGQLDDLGVAVLALEVFLRLCPTSARTYHEAAIAQRRAYSPMGPTDEIIEAEWRRS